MTKAQDNRNPLGDLLNALMAEADCDPERALELACLRLGDGSLHRLASEHDLVMNALRAACVEIVENDKHDSFRKGDSENVKGSKAISLEACPARDTD